MARTDRSSSTALSLRARVTCPHCWKVFSPGDVLWVAAHPDLAGDSRLGAEAQQRFLPTRFTVDGQAIDVKGLTCKQLACPSCHLVVPRTLLEMSPVFISTLGAPGSGKSYFLASMTWQMRSSLSKYFQVAFADADPEANGVLNEYEETLFLNPNEDQLVRLRKTEPEGELYNSVQDGERLVLYPKPFVFSLQPQSSRLDRHKQQKLSRALCLYDNAGEHFMPGGQSESSPVTKHLALSRALLFLFDPTQHPRFRKACQGKNEDPQMGDRGFRHRQDQILLEAAKRIRSDSKLAQNEKYPRPLIVVVTKYDAWSALTDNAGLDLKMVIRSVGDGAGLDVEALKRMSAKVRKIVSELAPEVVSAAEGFAEDVTYIPVSALGRGPEVDPRSEQLRIRPRDVEPMFAEIPLLYALHRTVTGMVPGVKHKQGKQQRRPDSDGKQSGKTAETSSSRKKKKSSSGKRQDEPQTAHLSEPAQETYLTEPPPAADAAEPSPNANLKGTGT